MSFFLTNIVLIIKFSIQNARIDCFIQEVLFGKVSNISAFEGEEIINLSVHQNGQIKHF